MHTADPADLDVLEHARVLGIGYDADAVAHVLKPGVWFAMSDIPYGAKVLLLDIVDNSVTPFRPTFPPGFTPIQCL